ncbi:hypothetical protein [Candidatus Bartonella washoeensis]|nr:hypothetical protein [Bartonella washoeensis]
MKWKNSAFYNKLRSFFEQEFFSAREHVVLCFFSLILEMCGKIVFMPILAQLGSTGAQAESIGVQDTLLFSLRALGSSCSVCSYLYSRYGDTLHHIMVFVGKNTQKLKEINQQRGKITCQQKDRYKKGERGKIYDTLVAIFFSCLCW